MGCRGCKARQQQCEQQEGRPSKAVDDRSLPILSDSVISLELYVPEDLDEYLPKTLSI